MRSRAHVRAIGLSVLASILALWPSPPQQGYSCPPSRELPFPVGERLTYAITWTRHLVVGEMTLSVKARGHFFDRAGVHLELRASTVGAARALVKTLEERWTSYVDPETWLPYRVEHSRQDGDRRTDRTIALDHRKGIARVSTGGTISIAPETRDAVAFLYYLRTLPLQPRDRRRFSLLSEKRRVPVWIEVGSRAPVETRAGRFEAIELIVHREDIRRAASDPSPLRLWLSADERRLPVLITAQEGIGEIRAELTEMAREGTLISTANRQPQEEIR